MIVMPLKAGSFIQSAMLKNQTHSMTWPLQTEDKNLSSATID